MDRSEYPRGGEQRADRTLSAMRPPKQSDTTVKAAHAMATSAGFALNDFSRATLDWAWTCDARLCITDLSEGFTAMTGLLPAALLDAPLETLGTFVNQASLGDDAGKTLAKLASGQGITKALFSLNTTEAPTFVEMSAVPIFDSDKNLIGIEGGVVKPKPKAPAAQDQMSSYTAKQLDLAHQVQHELRTPLNAIVGFAQIMREDLKARSDGRYAAYCDDILSASNHLLGLIDDMVGAHGAQEASLTPPTVTVFQLSTFLEEIARMMEPSATQRGQALVIDKVASDFECTTDRRRLKQICVNLLENAIKFTPYGGRIGISVALDRPDGVDLCVWDEGAGISEQDQQAIWRRFEKGGAPSSLTASSPGLGLGLSVVKALSDSIGAQIILDSAPGRGSRFTLRLPNVTQL